MIANLLLGALLSFGITFYAIPKVLKIAHLKKLFDIPDERKVHKSPIPSLGGVAIFAGFVISLLALSIFETTNSLQYFLLSFIVVFFFGIKDDTVGLTPQKKVVGQIGAAALLMFKANLLLTNLHGFIGIHSLNNPLSYVITIATIIVIMNAFNLIDGIDGLAATISIITCCTFSWYFYLNADFVYSALGFTFAGSLIAFLIFNYPPARIFMGDTGSMMCGIVNAILVIHFINTANASTVFQIPASPALGFGILIMPLLDTLRVFALRILQGKSPFFPDRNHLHHILLDRGLSHKVITIIIALSTVAFIALTYVALPMGTTAVIASQLCLFFAGVFFLQITAKKNKQKLQVLNQEPDITFSKKIKHVVTLIVAKEPEAKNAS